MKKYSKPLIYVNKFDTDDSTNSVTTASTNFRYGESTLDSWHKGIASISLNSLNK